MDLQVTGNFPQNTSYTLTNGIATAGGTNFEVRVVNSLSFVQFSSNIAGVTGVRKLKGDYNPTAEYYNLYIPPNATGAPRLVQVYGLPLYHEPNEGVLILQAYQNG